MDIPEPRNLSQELNLIKNHDGLDGLPGYVVVVFERLEHGGAKFAKIVNSDERFKRFFLPFFSSPDNYFGVAVNQSVLSFSFEVPVRLDDDLHEFTLISHLTFRASNPRVLAELSSHDPLRRLTDRIAMLISRNCGSRKWEMVKERFRELERTVFNEERVKLTQTAAELGIELLSLHLDRRFPANEVESHKTKLKLDTSVESQDPLKTKDLELRKRSGRIHNTGGNDPRKRAGGDAQTKSIRAGGDAQIKSVRDSTEGNNDQVACSVFAPRIARRGSSIFVQVFAHLEEDEAVAKAMAAEFDPEAERLAYKTLDREVQRGTKLVFCISIPGLQVDDSVQELIWRGRPESVQFGVRVPKDFLDNEIIGTIYVSQNSIPFGHVKFLLRIEDVDTEKENQAPNTWKRYDYAFISYASPDRPEVLKRVQMLSRLHIEFFQDLLTLEPGERWEKGIYKGIDRSDVFFLFWSTAAKNSEWVMKELRYALNRKGADEFASPEIVPVIIEGPPLVPPPDELKHIHFNDRFIYFIN